VKFKKDYIFCAITIITVFLFFLHTLSYPWRHFDEQIIYNETILPVPVSFLQIIEFISNFGLNNYIEASNPFYTTISNMRCAPFGALFFFFIFWLFQKSAFTYHLFSLLIHLLNSFLCFLILNKTSLKIFNSGHSSNLIRLSLITILSLFWALHPANIETILLATNCGALVTYLFCLLFIFYFTDNNSSLNNRIFLSLVYFIPLLLNEYSITLPFILLTYLCATSIFYSDSNSLKETFIKSIKRMFPLFLTLILFTIYFLSLPNLRIFQDKNLSLSIERIFWFSPQIFFHFIKLIVFPLHLTIDQSTLVKISNTLFAPYAIFCFLFLFGLIIFSIISLLRLKQGAYFHFFILFVPFFLSLFPFLHIISPLYNLVSERYLYFPSFLFMFGVSHILFFIASKSSVKKQIVITSIMFFLMISFSCRAYLRTLDWKDSASLFMSALKEAKSNLTKGLRMQMLGGVLYSYYNNTALKEAGEKYIEDGLHLLEDSLDKLETERIQYENELPQIIKFYGLDPKTIQAKISYLIAFTQLGMERNLQKAYEIMRPYMEDLSVIDTQILDLYAGLLFSLQKTDKAEVLLNHALEKKLSPRILLPLSEIYKNKYKDLSKAEALLKESFKYFPYDSETLQSLKTFYLQTNNLPKYEFYSYLHALRTHQKESSGTYIIKK